MWQDYIISIVGFSFAFMLIPQVKSSLKGQHVNKWSSGLTALGLFVLMICFASMDMWLSPIANFMTGSMWALIFVLAWIEKTSIT